MSIVGDLIFSSSLSEEVKEEIVGNVLEMLPCEEIADNLLAEAESPKDIAIILEALPRYGVYREIKKTLWKEVCTLDESIINEVSNDYILRAAKSSLEKRKKLADSEPIGLARINNPENVRRDRAQAIYDLAKQNKQKSNFFKNALDRTKSSINKVSDKVNNKVQDTVSKTKTMIGRVKDAVNVLKGQYPDKPKTDTNTQEKKPEKAKIESWQKTPDNIKQLRAEENKREKENKEYQAKIEAKKEQQRKENEEAKKAKSAETSANSSNTDNKTAETSASTENTNQQNNTSNNNDNKKSDDAISQAAETGKDMGSDAQQSQRQNQPAENKTDSSNKISEIQKLIDNLTDEYGKTTGRKRGSIMSRINKLRKQMDALKQNTSGLMK